MRIILSEVAKAREEGRWPFADPETKDLPDDLELPKDLSEGKFVRGLSCFGHARLILESRGGRKVGNIYEVNNGGIDIHAYVVLNEGTPVSLALNDTLERHLTEELVRKTGRDVTSWVYKQEWEEL